MHFSFNVYKVGHGSRPLVGRVRSGQVGSGRVGSYESDWTTDAECYANEILVSAESQVSFAFLSD